jgi:energy-coupling factor transporter ATP-binding protein EcfA2
MDRSERVLVKYPLFKAAISRIQACFDSYETTAEPDCCPIVGESGSGKTTIISYFASLHPRVDRKTGVEVPVLIARVPARPSVKSFAETLLYQLGDPLWSRGNTVSQSIRLRELLKRCRVRLLALDEFQHFVDVRRANIPNEVADWLKEQVEEAKLAIVVLGLERCLEVLRQNEQLRRRFGATLRMGAFRWNLKEDLRRTERSCAPCKNSLLSTPCQFYRMWIWRSGCTTLPTAYGLIGYTMKILRGAVRIASSHPRREITLHTLSESFAEHVWSERLNDPNPFVDSFDIAKASTPVLPGFEERISPVRVAANSIGPELHA